MNNFYTRLVVGIILGIVSSVIIISMVLRAESIQEEMSKPRKEWKFEKRRLFIDLPEEEISKDENNPDTVVMFVKNDTLFVGYFNDY